MMGDCKLSGGGIPPPKKKMSGINTVYSALFVILMHMLVSARAQCYGPVWYINPRFTYLLTYLQEGLYFMPFISMALRYGTR